MIIQSVGLGLVISLIFSEIFGLAAGGMVVPGYIALQLHQPLKILGTVIASLLTYAFTKFLANFIFLYGRRRFVLNILMGFLISNLLPLFLSFSFAETRVQLQAIGLIIPGLIANWMEQQGILQTILVMLIGASLVRILLIIITTGIIIQ